MRESPSPTTLSPRDLERERKFLWGLGYRMTGSAADAEDIVQETFIRALEKPPRDGSQPLRPWLVKVTMNLARDLLRRRKRRGYPGTWLPEPLETPEEGHTDDASSAEARYGLFESASFAFLVAVEALTPSQRAVLVLRDAFDYSSREAADALDMSEENVRITLHRARKAMEAYDHDKRSPSGDRAEQAARVRTVLLQLYTCLANKDHAGARALFRADAHALSDGGGVQHAARVAVKGPERIVNMYVKLGTRASSDRRFEVRSINGLPAVVGVDPRPKRPNAPRFVTTIDLDREGKIRALYSVLAPDKLQRIHFPLVQA